MKIIDCYGFDSNTESDRFLRLKKQPAEVDTATAGTTYIRYTGGTAACPITRIVEAAGVTTVRWGYGAWADRATLEYTLTPAEALAVEE